MDLPREETHSMPHSDIAVSHIVILFMHKNSGTNKDGVTVSEAALVFPL